MTDDAPPPRPSQKSFETLVAEAVDRRVDAKFDSMFPMQVEQIDLGKQAVEYMKAAAEERERRARADEEARQKRVKAAQSFYAYAKAMGAGVAAVIAAIEAYARLFHH